MLHATAASPESAIPASPKAGWSSSGSQAPDSAIAETDFWAYLDRSLADLDPPSAGPVTSKNLPRSPQAASEKRTSRGPIAPVVVTVDTPAPPLRAFNSPKPPAEEESAGDFPAFSEKPASGADTPFLGCPETAAATAPEARACPGSEIQGAAVPELAFQARLIPEISANAPSSVEPARQPESGGAGPAPEALQPAEPISQHIVPPGGEASGIAAGSPPDDSTDNPAAKPGSGPLHRLSRAAFEKPAGSAQPDAPETDDPVRTPDSTVAVSAVKNTAAGGNPGDSHDGPMPVAPADNPAVPSGLPAAGVFVPQSESPLAASPPPATASPMARAETPPEAPPQPVSHDLALRLDGQGNVDIRMTERAGEIRVTVHTTDPDLASSLRVDLPELVGKLRQSGFQTEAWHPGAVLQAGVGSRSAADLRGGAQDTPDGRREGHQPPHPKQPRNSARWAGEWNARLEPAQESQT